jgi:hypothetical protein
MKIKRDYVLSVALNEHERDMLEKIGEAMHLTKSEVIRQIIRTEYEGRFGKEN